MRRYASGRSRAVTRWRGAPFRLPFGRWRWIGLAALLLGSVIGLRETEVFQPVEVSYSRALYPHWLDLDRDCRDSRQETLAAQSEQPPRWSPGGCRIEAGRWRDPYTGAVFSDPRRLDVDHIVPLAEAHRSGASKWRPEQRAAFANDPDNLVAVDRSANRAKGDGDPLSWLPPSVGAWCGYVSRFVAVKRKYGLEQDAPERWWTEILLWFCRV